MDPSGIDLYWLPLGAGGWFVRLNGRVYEALMAARGRRPRADLYHSALIVTVPEGCYAIESGRVSNSNSASRGVVCEGAVGHRALGPFRVFRYEVRCWRGGVVPDLDEAVDSPRRLTGETAIARRLLDLAPRMPNPVWGRDELRTGDMWNSNSVVSWLVTASGLDAESIRPPVGGRAPGWSAGVVTARRRGADRLTR
jgi:hypothetical protein